jgi:AraC family transcriptional regulator, regulatory protein of adaptative response / methylated-DNA-[protein]-cysteine methyltransferase
MQAPAQLPLANQQNYERMARAIAFLCRHQQEQPDLATVAQHIQLSESHFQRLFTQWVGISPKRFLQYLTVEYAKQCLAESQNVLDLTLAVGLSSPGRLHDLFVHLEAMSPGEAKSGGRGLTIRYGLQETAFGHTWIATTPRGICQLSFLESSEPEDPLARLRQEWWQAELIHDPSAVQAVGDRLLSPPTWQTPQPISLLVKGSNFQIQVWRALLNIPFGCLTSYQGLAQLIGRPTAARAVGHAVGSNPVAYLIPCHRVIRESGALGGYRWGLARKAVMLGWEAGWSQPEAEK